MAGIDVLTLAVAKKYTRDTANALGAVKGAPCTILSIENDGEFSIVLFGWTGTDGTQQTSTLMIPNGFTKEQASALEEKIDEQEDLIVASILKESDEVTINNQILGIGQVNINKIVQTEGDFLILDGGGAPLDTLPVLDSATLDSMILE